MTRQLLLCVEYLQVSITEVLAGELLHIRICPIVRISSKLATRVIGIDVSKDKLDISNFGSSTNEVRDREMTDSGRVDLACGVKPL